MGFAGGGACRRDSFVRPMDDYRGTYETVGRRVADTAVGFQTRQDCESAGRAASDDGDRANRRQPQQQDFSHAGLPGLLEGVGAQPRDVQD